MTVKRASGNCVRSQPQATNKGFNRCELAEDLVTGGSLVAEDVVLGRSWRVAQQNSSSKDEEESNVERRRSIYYRIILQFPN